MGWFRGFQRVLSTDHVPLPLKGFHNFFILVAITRSLGALTGHLGHLRLIPPAQNQAHQEEGAGGHHLYLAGELSCQLFDPCCGGHVPLCVGALTTPSILAGGWVSSLGGLPPSLRAGRASCNSAKELRRSSLKVATVGCRRSSNTKDHPGMCYENLEDQSFVGSMYFTLCLHKHPAR